MILIRSDFPRSNIILIGMPAVGKSTVGVLLAKRLGWAFLDTDILIQIKEKQRLQTILDAQGMDAFCRMEERHIMSIAADAHVIATGGSAVYGPGAMAHLKTLGTVFHLDLPPAILQKRLNNLSSRGVVMTPGQDIASLYRERYPLYRHYADITLDCNDQNPDQIVGRIERWFLES
jgi:shikimate kinase